MWKVQDYRSSRGQGRGLVEVLRGCQCHPDGRVGSETAGGFQSEGEGGGSERDEGYQVR